MSNNTSARDAAAREAESEARTRYPAASGAARLQRFAFLAGVEWAHAASTEAPASQGATTDACGCFVVAGICAAPKVAHEGGALGHPFDAAFPDASQGEAGELQRLRAMEARAKAQMEYFAAKDDAEVFASWDTARFILEGTEA